MTMNAILAGYEANEAEARKNYETHIQEMAEVSKIILSTTDDKIVDDFVHEAECGLRDLKVWAHAAKQLLAAKRYR